MNNQRRSLVLAGLCFIFMMSCLAGELTAPSTPGDELPTDELSPFGANLDSEHF